MNNTTQLTLKYIRKGGKWERFPTSVYKSFMEHENHLLNYDNFGKPTSAFCIRSRSKKWNGNWYKFVSEAGPMQGVTHSWIILVDKTDHSKELRRWRMGFC